MNTFNNNNDNRYVMFDFSLKFDQKIDMKSHVGITYKHTKYIQKIIKYENWDNRYTKLFYYIDYTFRARYYDNKIKIYKFNDNESICIFCINLYRKNDVNNNDPLYMVFKHKKGFISKNKFYRNQKWLLSDGMLYSYIYR